MRTATIRALAITVAIGLGTPAVVQAAPDSESAATRYLDFLDEKGAKTDALRELLEKDDAELRRNVIHLALQKQYPAYREAVERFHAGAANAEDFAAILGLKPEGEKEGAAPDPASPEGSEQPASPEGSEQEKTIAADPYLQAHASYYLGRALLRRDEPATAALVLRSLVFERNRFHQWPAQARLHGALAEASVPNVDGAKKLLRELMDRAGPETPERYYEAAVFIYRELLGEGSGPLVEIARKMEWIERRLDGGESGQRVKTRQKEVLDTLDELIAMLREKQQQGQGQGQGQSGGT